MVAFNSVDPRSITLKDAETMSGIGLIITNDSTNNKAKIHPGGAVVPIGITVGESSRDADQAFETTGATVSFMPLVGVQMVPWRVAVLVHQVCRARWRGNFLVTCFCAARHHQLR